MQTAIAEFAVTNERDIVWAVQRARLLGNLAGLTQKDCLAFGKAVKISMQAVSSEKGQGMIQFSVGSDTSAPFIEAVTRAQGTHPDLLDLDIPRLRTLVDSISVNTNPAASTGIVLRKYLPAFAPRFRIEETADWGTMLSTRTAQSALVGTQQRLRELSKSLSSAEQSKANLEQQLREIQSQRHIHELLALVASTTDNSVIIMDQQGRIEWVNDSFSRMTGFNLVEVQGQPFISILMGEATDTAAIEEIKAAMNFNHGQSREILRYRKDGKTYWELLSLTPVFDKSGCAARWVCIGADITARRTAEESLEQAKIAAEVASHAKSVFLANMSHEIRTPLNAIIGMTDLTLGTNLTEEQREYLTTVRESAIALMQLLNDILDLSKIEARKLTIDKVPFNLKRVLQSTMKSFVLQANSRGLEFHWHLQPGTPEHLVGDPARVRQILVNLVSNAIKFTERGEVQVHIGPQWQSGDQTSLVFRVRDTGIGISPDALARIFDAFSQADSSIASQYGGTGLGLAIASQLVELLGGHIWVQSERGKGSTFHFSLPYQIASAPPDTHGPEPSDYEDSFAPANHLEPMKQLRILVADDNKANRRLAQRLLEKHNHIVTLASNGREALKWMDQQVFDVVVMDVQMPELDGLAFTAQVRDRERGSATHLPIIAMTAHAMKGDEQRCLAAGMDAYVSKPLVAKTFCGLVESFGNPPAPIAQDAGPIRLGGNSHDFTRALERLDGDHELLQEQMRLFLEEIPDLLVQLQDAIKKEEAERLHLIAHRIKGLASSLDGQETSDAASELEQLGKTRQLHYAMDSFHRLESALTSLTQAVRIFLGDT
ncbi:MAG: response regulator [Pirellulales bacterium]|nr:response regulator [Pirellulales bacterium]